MSSGLIFLSIKWGSPASGSGDGGRTVGSVGSTVGTVEGSLSHLLLLTSPHTPPPLIISSSRFPFCLIHIPCTHNSVCVHRSCFWMPGLKVHKVRRTVLLPCAVPAGLATMHLLQLCLSLYHRDQANMALGWLELPTALVRHPEFFLQCECLN